MDNGPAVDLAPDGRRSVCHDAVTRRAPYVCLATWPGGHEDPHRKKFQPKIIDFLDSAPSEPSSSEEYKRVWDRSTKRTAELLAESGDDSNFYRRVAFRLSSAVANRFPARRDIAGPMKILLIGGTGFIGRFVAAELARRGHELAIFHRGATKLEGPHLSITGDRRRLAESRDTLRAWGPEVIVDLVLSSGAQARELIEVARGVARHVVALSSMDVYRACGVLHRLEPGPLEPLPLTEASALRTRLQTYPKEQIAALQQIFGWADDDYDKIPVEQALLGAGDVRTTILRLPMVFGPFDLLRRLHPIVKRIDDGRRALVLPEPLSAWRATRGYVENVAAAIALAACSETAAGVYNVGDPDALSELEWARRVGAAAGWEGEIVVLPEEATPPHLRLPGNAAQHWIADSSRLRGELGYVEPVERDEAIRRAIAWERATPVAGLILHAFDYAAEDAALEAAGRPRA